MQHVLHRVGRGPFEVSHKLGRVGVGLGLIVRLGQKSLDGAVQFCFPNAVLQRLEDYAALVDLLLAAGDKITLSFR